ncbi:glutaminase A [Bacteroides ovatus]|nr:glutaminase A [Bacteroides ovatus]
MKKLLTVMAFSVGLFANAQTGNLFKPVKEVALRTPVGTYRCFRSSLLYLVSL